MTKLLAFDTTTEACSVALAIDDTVHAHFEICPRQHGHRILPLIETQLAKANINIHDLDALAFSHGPGSFTGIRIAISVVQALAVATRCPVVSVSSLAAIAATAREQSDCEYIITAIDARMNEIYFAAYYLSTAVHQDCVISPNDLPNLPTQKWYGAGNAWSVYADQLNSTYAEHLAGVNPQIYPNAKSIAQLGLKELQQGNSLSYHDIVPNYIRNKVTN